MMPCACLARRDFGHMAEGGVSIDALPTGLCGRGMLVQELGGYHNHLAQVLIRGSFRLCPLK